MSGRTSASFSSGEPAVAHGDDLEVLVGEGQLDDLLDRDAVVGQQDLLAHPLVGPQARPFDTPLPASRLRSDRRFDQDRPFPPVCQRVSGTGRSGVSRPRRPMTPDDVLGRGPRQEHLGDAELFSSGMSCAGMIPPTKTRTRVHPLLPQQLEDPPADRQVGAREDREADHVGVLLRGGGHDLLGALAQAGVDHLHARVAQRARDDLGAAVVAVEPRLRDHDPDASVFAATTASLERRAACARTGPLDVSRRPAVPSYSPKTSRSASHISPSVA